MPTETIETFAALKEEPNWSVEAREKAKAVIDQLDPPVVERVKFNRWPLMQQEMGEAFVSEYAAVEPAMTIDDNEPAKIIQYGNQTVAVGLDQALIDQGVVVMDLFEAMTAYPDLIKDNLMTKGVPVTENNLTAYHRAYLNSGIVIYVPANVEVDQPIVARLIQDSTQKQAFNKHVLVIAGENSRFEYIEQWETVGDVPNSANIVVELLLNSGAKVQYTALDNLGPHNHIYLNRRSHLEKDAVIEWAIGEMTEGNLIGDFDADLVGYGSQSYVNIVAISSGKQIVGIDTRVTNIAPYSVGHILQHGVIMDRSTLTFNGIGHILKKAHGSEAQQESRVLMLSDQARGDANPILLIDEHDVTAGHAASVGQIDDEQLFYLKSRGLSEEMAKRLVIRGFLGKVISSISVARIRKELIRLIDRKLGYDED